MWQDKRGCQAGVRLHSSPPLEVCWGRLFRSGGGDYSAGPVSAGSEISHQASPSVRWRMPLEKTCPHHPSFVSKAWARFLEQGPCGLRGIR